MSEYIVVRGVSAREDGTWYDRSRMKVRDKRLDVSGLRDISLSPTGVFETRDDGARAEVCRPDTRMVTDAEARQYDWLKQMDGPMGTGDIIKRLFADRERWIALAEEFCDEYEALERIIRDKVGIPNLGVNADTVAKRGRKLLKEAHGE